MSPTLRRLLLQPASWLYGLGVGARNLMFDLGLLKSQEFPVPVIVVGNLAVGGTGKTPHVEYLIEMLHHTWHIGMLSRGYRRATKGFVMATRHSTPRDIGDEPYQIYRKYQADVAVAVCEDRVRGIQEMMQIDPAINLIIMDDAFQHRYVKPTCAVVLTDYNHPLADDALLPYGRLREPVSALGRAHIVIGTRCPDDIQPIEYKIFSKGLQLQPWQGLFYSSIKYLHLQPVFPDEAPDAPDIAPFTRRDIMYLVAGIAQPESLLLYLKTHSGARVQYTLFPDHRDFTRHDFEVISRRWARLKGDTRIIVTTEKDAVRMASNPYFPHDLRPYIYYQPIQIVIDQGRAHEFEDKIREWIGKH